MRNIRACAIGALLGLVISMTAAPAHWLTATPIKRVIDTPTHLRLQWYDAKGVVQDIDVTVAFKALVYTKPLATASPMGVVWGGPPPRAAGCTDAQFNYTRTGGVFNSVIYKTHLHLNWCFFGDHIASTTHKYGDLHPWWWFSDLAPGSSAFGGVSTAQYWNPFAGRAYDSSSYIRKQQGWHQCLPIITCNNTEYPWIWVSALGNGQFYWNAGR